MGGKPLCFIIYCQPCILSTAMKCHIKMEPTKGKKDLLRHFMHTFCDGDQKLGVVEFNVLLES